MSTLPSVSFIMPAYNAAATIEDSIRSIIDGNLHDGDQIVVVDDGSTDVTADVVQKIASNCSAVRLFNHLENRGGGAARNTAVRNARHNLLFCLDSDNILLPDSVEILRKSMSNDAVDVVSFQQIQFFRDDPTRSTHSWIMRAGYVMLGDVLASEIVPGASGNYLFTRESWDKAGGYPESHGALDAWGFGFRQLASGARILVVPQTAYRHRYGHDSYWCREVRTGSISTHAAQIVLEFASLLDPKDVAYLQSQDGRKKWFKNLRYRPLRVQGQPLGHGGRVLMHGIGAKVKYNLVQFFGVLGRALPFLSSVR